MFEDVIMEQLEFVFEYSEKENNFSLNLWKEFEENAKQISEMVRTFSPEQLELSFWTFLSGFFKSLSEQFLSLLQYFKGLHKSA